MSRESFFQADEHVILVCFFVGWFMYVVFVCIYRVLAEFCIKIQHFFLIDSASSCPGSLSTWSKLAS